jgi:hypothetical protein
MAQNLTHRIRLFPVPFQLCSIRKLLNCGDIPSVPTVPGLPVLNNELQLYMARKLKTRNNRNKLRFQGFQAH